MSHSWSGWLGKVLEAPDPVQAYFSFNETLWTLDCVDDTTNAMPVPCAYDCANITAITSMSAVSNTLWQCIFYPNVTNDFRQGILSQAQDSFLDKAHVDTSLAKAATVTSTISTCLSAFCEGLEGCKQLRPFACSPASLSINGSMFNLNATDACVEAICANHPEPLTNTDIAGIGVVLSYIIQFALTLLGALALVILQYLFKADSRYISVPHGRHARGAALSQDGSRNQDSDAQVKSQPEAEAGVPQEPWLQRPAELEQIPEIYQEMSRVPTIYNAIVAALVEFLKAQCFTAIAVCIAALIILNSHVQLNLIDAVALGAAGGISIIPITFNYYILACFNTDPRDHKRKSWFIYGLCLCSWVLGLSVVLSPQMFQANDGTLIPEQGSNGIFNSQYPNACGNASPLNICPRSNQQYFVNPEYTFFYTLCVPTMVGLTVWQLTTLASVSRFLSTIFYKDSQANIRLFTLLHFVALGLFVAPTAFFFESLSDLFRQDNISFDWTFGQILAITLWIPSLVGFVEYLGRGFPNAHDEQIPFRYSTKTNY